MHHCLGGIQGVYKGGKRTRVNKGGNTKGIGKALRRLLDKEVCWIVRELMEEPKRTSGRPGDAQGWTYKGQHQQHAFVT